MRITGFDDKTKNLLIDISRMEADNLVRMSVALFNETQGIAAQDLPKVKDLMTNGLSAAYDMDELVGQEEQKIIPVPVHRVMDLCGALHYFANDHSGLFSSCSSYRKQAREMSQLLFDGYIRQSGTEAYRPGKTGLQTMVTNLIS